MSDWMKTLHLSLVTMMAVAAWGCGSGDESLATSISNLQTGNVTIVAQHSGKCVDIVSGKVLQETCSGASSQNWVFHPVTGGYQIVSAASPTLCLKITGASTKLGALATVSACSPAGVAGEVWTTQASGSNLRLSVVSDKLCMDVDGASQSNGATVSQWTCVAQSNEFFALNGASPPPDAAIDSGADAAAEAAAPDTGGPDGPLGTGAAIPTGSPVTLTAQHSGKCIDLLSGSALQEACSGAASQKWIFNPVVGGYQILSATNTTLCLNIPGASATLGARLAVSSCSSAGIPGEIWNPQATGSSFYLVATHDNQCMDVDGVDTSNGATLSQWTCVGQSNEVFAVTSTSPPQDSGTGADAAAEAAAPDTGTSDAPLGTGAAIPTGSPVTVTAQHSGKCIDLVSGSALQEACSGSASQKWIFKPVVGGYQILSATNTTLCLNIAGGSPAPGAKLVVSSCSSSGVAGEIWNPQATGSSFYLVATHDNLCMDVDGADTSNGATLSQWTCVGQSNEVFSVTSTTPPPDSGTGSADAAAEAATPDTGTSDAPLGTGAAIPTGSPVTVTAQHSGKCIDLVSGSAMQEACSGSATQKWIFNPVVGGYQILSATNTTLCLNIAGGSAALGAALVVSTCSSSGVAGEIWNPQATGSSFYLVATHDNLCIDVNGADTSDGATLSQWTCVGQSNEVFAVTSTSPPPDSGTGGADAAVDASTPPDAGLGTDAGTPVGSPVTLVARNSGKCLDISAGYVVQEPCIGAPSQNWILRPAPGGYQIVWAPDPTRCINIPGASPTLAAKAMVSTCSSGGVAGEIWNPQASGSDFSLVAMHDSLCMDVDGADTSSGATLSQWTCVGGATNEIFTIGAAPAPPTPSVNGGWSTVLDLPSIPVAAAVLPNGKIVAWSSWQPDDFRNSGNLGQTYTSIIDPQVPSALGVLVTQTSHDMFCPGTALMSDGRLFVNGGGADVANTSIYDGVAGTWAADALMNEPRWYAVSVTLPDGRIFTLGGNRLSGQSGTGEIWTPGVGWKYVPNAVMTPLLTADPTANAINRSEEHPRMFVAPNGKIFVPGPTPNMQWYDLTGNGTITPAGPRGDDTFSQNDATVMFDVGKILKAGGNPNYGVGAADQSPSSGNAYVIDINGGGLANVTKIAPLTHPRAYATGVVLPDGTVLVAGGLDNGMAFSDTGALFAPELFDPVSQTWRDLAPMAVPRAYHSVALLIPDGRVFVGGGGLCGHGCAQNHADAQFFSPPYLFQPGRPRISSAPSSASYGSAFPVTTSGTVTRFTWVRMSSVTHTVNTDQRWLSAASTATGGGSFSVTAPASANVAPPGNYMLFALNGGVPSVAAIVRVGP